MAGGLHDDVSREAQKIAQREQLLRRGIARRIFPLRRIWKHRAGAEDMAMRVHRARWRLEARLRRIGMPVNPAFGFLKASHPATPDGAYVLDRPPPLPLPTRGRGFPSASEIRQPRASQSSRAQNVVEPRIDASHILLEHLELFGVRNGQPIDVTPRVVEILAGFGIDAAHCA